MAIAPQFSWDTVYILVQRQFNRYNSTRILISITRSTGILKNSIALGELWNKNPAIGLRQRSVGLLRRKAIPPADTNLVPLDLCYANLPTAFGWLAKVFCWLTLPFNLGRFVQMLQVMINC